MPHLLPIAIRNFYGDCANSKHMYAYANWRNRTSKNMPRELRLQMTTALRLGAKLSDLLGMIDSFADDYPPSWARPEVQREVRAEAIAKHDELDHLIESVDKQVNRFAVVVAELSTKIGVDISRSAFDRKADVLLLCRTELQTLRNLMIRVQR